MNKIIDLIFIILALAIIICPIVFINRETGKVSETEKRMLADPPTAEFGTEEYKTQLSDWLNDNVGFRDKLLNMRTTVMFKGLNIMPTEKVQKGKNGFYFYTLDNNLEIAKGTYPVDEEKLKEIAKVQQAISDYYKKIGKEYVLVLTPSKVSIYPEYLHGDYSVRETPCDLIYDYLKENTDVTVINTKDKLLENKDKGQLFWKTDSHWTRLGAYYAYLAIIEGMNEAGITDIEPVEAEIVDEKMVGEFSSMIGVQSILGEETADGIAFDETSRLTTEGEFCDKLNEICHANGVGTARSHNAMAFYNDNKQNMPRIMLLSDSQFMTMRKIPNLLAESFSEVVLLRLRKVVPEMDMLTDPDIIIFTCSERYTENLLSTMPAGINIVESKEPVGFNNMWLDQYNGVKPEKRGEIVIDRDASEVSLSGWAVDSNSKKNLSKLYVKAGNNIITCQYGIERTSVADRYNEPGYLNSGFTASFDAAVLYNEDGELLDSISFVFVGNDETYMYEPVEYKLK